MRFTLSAVAAYVIYFVWIVVMFSVLWLMLGASFAYFPGSTRVTAGWLLAATPVNLVGAMLAGWLAGVMSRGDRRAVNGLAALVVILGLAVAIVHLGADRSLPPGKVPSQLSAQEAGQYSIQPTWYEFVIPIAAAGAVLAGGGALKRRAAVAHAAA